MLSNTHAVDTAVAQTGTALDEIVASDPTTFLAPIAAIVAAYLLFYEGLLFAMGSDSTFWRRIRSLLPVVDEAARDQGFYTGYTIRETETVGHLVCSLDEAIALFKRHGFIDAPLAAHKTLEDGREELASLGYYGVNGERLEAMSRPARFLTMLVLPKKIHVTLFRAADNDDILVTAHFEFSEYNVFYTLWHFRGKGLDVDEGVRRSVDVLAEEKRFQPSERALRLWLDWSKSAS